MNTPQEILNFYFVKTKDKNQDWYYQSVPSHLIAGRKYNKSDFEKAVKDLKEVK